jgi:hypothetical protein
MQITVTASVNTFRHTALVATVLQPLS